MAPSKEGGFKLSLGPLKAKTGLKASSLQKDTKKSRLALDDDEPDESNQHQEILGWDAAEGGALDAKGKKEKDGPRIIPALPNRDWRAEAKRKQLAKAPHQQAQNGEVMEHIEAPKIQHGLIVFKKDKVRESVVEETGTPEPAQAEKDNLTEEQRLEKKALDVLLNGKSTDDDLVIPLQTQEDAFSNDLRNAPEAPTLAAYEATPIEGFGAALLRGMGWKDGETNGNNGSAAKPKEVKRRPALLGIGAKEEAAVGVELGEWGNKGKHRKNAKTYNPVTLQNKHTGEVLTEEELKAKLENQDMVQDERPDKDRRRHAMDEGERDERRREKRREKGDSSRRDRDDKYDSDRRRDKRRDRDDDYDSERKKERRRERSRDGDYDSERRREKRRDRSRSPDGRKEKRRDRYRSRSRESKQQRSHRDRSEESEDRRKRRRDRDYEYEDGREDRKRRHKDERYYK